jgi:putative ubiquitin-RnfH superfamily antitoxin RatB of RatAB toxin-antitoxin module
MARADVITVTVVHCPAPGEVDEVALRLAAEATLHEAVLASGMLDRHPSIDLSVHRVGIWGRTRPLDAPLRDRDRIEIYRPLKVDPKQARRERAARPSPTCSPRR